MSTEKLTAKEILQIVIMVTAMHFGFCDMYRTLWLAAGLPCAIWLQGVIILLAGGTNYLFIRWCGSEKNGKNEKQRIRRRNAKSGRQLDGHYAGNKETMVGDRRPYRGVTGSDDDSAGKQKERLHIKIHTGYRG